MQYAHEKIFFVFCTPLLVVGGSKYNYKFLHKGKDNKHLNADAQARRTHRKYLVNIRELCSTLLYHPNSKLNKNIGYERVTKSQYQKMKKSTQTPRFNIY